MSASAERPATLLAATETETPYGGRTQVWSPVATVWAQVTLAALDQATSADAPPADSQAATAITRDHPAAAAGQQLVLDGEPPFLVRELRHATPAPGRMTLILARLL